MSQATFQSMFVKRALHEGIAFWALGALALSAAACSAAAEDEGAFDAESEQVAEPDLADEEATGDVETGAVDEVEKQLKRAVSSPEHPDASCEPAPIFGNLVCVECTTGPFPTCTTYVCDKEGNNCKQTSRRLSASMQAVVSDAVLAR